ncbi:Uncharacterised protein [Mycobacteroides abscessus subsp. abscessus]|nr:Uncharacterised protein [Mycobacteroides abscessus subsp. abscessus]
MTMPTTTSSSGMIASNHHQWNWYHLPDSSGCEVTPPGRSTLGTCRPPSCDASSAGSVLNARLDLFHEIEPPVNFWLTTSPLTA